MHLFLEKNALDARLKCALGSSLRHLFLEKMHWMRDLNVHWALRASIFRKNALDARLKCAFGSSEGAFKTGL